MSWYNIRNCKCLDCSFEFAEEVSTLTIAKTNFGICPNCKCKNIIIKSNNQNKTIESVKKAFS